MSTFYPTYHLEVYSFSEKNWVRTAHEASNRPHHYDYLTSELQRLVRSARAEASPNQQPIGYRIYRTWDNGAGGPVDSWDNGKL